MAGRRELLRASQETSYGLRSLFFYRKLQEGKFKELYEAVTAIDCSSLDFSNLANLGIADEAAEFLAKQGIPICHVFCHPRVITDNPRLIVYYRGAAAISQKGMQKLARVGLAPFEAGINRRPLDADRAVRISVAVNRLVSPVVTDVVGFSLDVLQSQVLMTAGVQADGSWRGEIGTAASDIVKQLIIKDLLSHGQIAEDLSAEQVLAQRAFAVNNGYRIVFSSEPDISLLEPDGGTQAAVIEVKGGLDEAGALERYGAAKKSFDDALSRNPRVITVYLASTITPTVAERIRADRAVRETFDLTDILVDEAERERFLAQLYWWPHLQRGH